jgi:hypothetical protein
LAERHCPKARSGISRLLASKRNVGDSSLGFGQPFGILNSPPQKILVRSFTNRRVDLTSKAANPKAGGRGNCGQPNGLAEIGLAAAIKGAWN